MADDENAGEETSTRGNDWEVVSLTASAYAAAPTPKESESDDYKDLMSARAVEESARAMFMSDHFIFPPSQHENLPLEPGSIEIHNLTGIEGADSTQEGEPILAEGDRPGKAGEENWNIEGLPEADELHGIQLFGGKGKSFSGDSTEFEEGRALQELNLVKEEQSLLSAAKFGSFHSEADISGSTAAVSNESNIIPESDDPSQLSANSPLDSLQSQKAMKEGDNEPGLPCEAWWKRRAAALYSHVKEANTFWSVVVAATLMGLVILGQRWQQERWQIQQLKWQFGINDERINRMLSPVSRFKDILVGGHRRGQLLRGSSTSVEH